MYCENDYQAMKILKEGDQENILNALGLFEKKKLIHVKGKLSTNSEIIPEKRNSEPLRVFHSKLDHRRSLRIHTRSVDDFGNYVLPKYLCHLYSPDKIYKTRIRKKHSPNVYGSITGVSIGDKWNTRVECSNAGIHKPTVAGIHAGKKGAHSIVISGDYEDDQDNGYCFTYTGSSVRDLSGSKDRKTLRATHTRDQILDGADTSLIKSIETRNPVRVIRGYKLDSPFAPERGYRYDGLYTVEKYWACVGKSGSLVYKFLMKRCQNQAPAPWHRREPLNRIRIVKLRKKRPPVSTTVFNFSGKLTMSEGNGGPITTCQLSQMQLQLNAEISDTVTIDTSSVFMQRECEIQINPRDNFACQRATNIRNTKPCRQSCTISCKRRMADESNKENNNKVIIKTRWRKARQSLPNLRKRSISSPETSQSNKSTPRKNTKRLSCVDRKPTKKSLTPKRDEFKTPSIDYFNISNDQSFKWSLFASEEEIKLYRKYFRKNNVSRNMNHGEDYEGDFKGFERQDSLNKVMILGFIINDLEKK